jgi:hypothetical protein
MDRDLGRLTWSTTDEATPDERRAAALYVTSVAHDKADATHLLGALGLLPKRPRKKTKRTNQPASTPVTDCPINTTSWGDQ